MDVFNAFPNAVISGVWEIGTVLRGTEVGTKFLAHGFVDVIIDEETNGELDTSPNAEGITTGTLLYVAPDDLPETKPAALVGGYYFHNTETNTFYEITQVRVGKNQETGIIEHYEFLLKPTGVDYGDNG